MNKTLILNMLREFVARRPGLDYANYGDPSSYRAELRELTRQLREARVLIDAVDASAITGDQIAERLQTGRLTLAQTPRGDWRLEFVACQYEPVEYRPAVSRVMSDLLWESARVTWPNLDGTGLRTMFRRRFGLGVQRRFFN